MWVCVLLWPVLAPGQPRFHALFFPDAWRPAPYLPSQQEFEAPRRRQRADAQRPSTHVDVVPPALSTAADQTSPDIIE